MVTPKLGRNNSEQTTQKTTKEAKIAKTTNVNQEAAGGVGGAGNANLRPPLLLEPETLHFGKSYSDWVCDWFNWFVSVDADGRNTGPVVFLRSYGLPKEVDDDIRLKPKVSGGEPGSMGSEMMSYSRMHSNQPNIRIGSDRLQIFRDQAVLIPIINSYWVKYEPSMNEDWGTMLEYTSMAIDNGRSPPRNKQLKINGKEVIPDNRPMRDFRIVTPIFTAVVPDSEPGESVKDFLGHPMPSGNFPAMVQGYFVMVKFQEKGTYWVHSWGVAPADVRGSYFAELLYEIDVNDRLDEAKDVNITRPPGSVKSFNHILTSKEAIGDLTEDEMTQFKAYFLEETGTRRSGRGIIKRRKEIEEV